MRPADTPPSSAVPAIAAEQLARIPPADRPPVLDLRSPAEFADDHLPGAANVPLFDDAERALIGFLYKQRSPERAFERGIEIVAGKIGTLVERIAATAGWAAEESDLAERVRALGGGGIGRLEEGLREVPLGRLPARALVVHCWRGGLRSRSVAALLRSLGHGQVVVLAGGYKAWRRQVLAELEAFSAPPAFVLRGLTGVGKTLVLRALERRRPGLTIDLEGLAGHRSSLLGMVGLEPCSQKRFESRLFERSRRGFAEVVVLEGESRKVGDVVIPPAIWRVLRAGTAIELTASRERRVEVLIDDYLADSGARPALARQLAAVEGRMAGAPPLVELFAAGREREVVELLLERYYDPLYRRSEQGMRYATTIDAGDPERAADQVLELLDGRRGTGVTSAGARAPNRSPAPSR